MKPSSTLLEALKTPQRAPRWVWHLPWIAAFLLPVVIGLLLWLLYTNERDEQRTALISDALWIEQYLRFHMDRNLEQLGMLGADVFEHGLDSPASTLRAKTVVDQADGVVQILWLNTTGQTLKAVPSSLSRQPLATTKAQVDAFRSAARLGKPIYSAPYDLRRNDARFDVYVPYYRNDRLVGVTAAVYSSAALLNRMVPWWFTERYRLTLVDSNGVTLSANSSVGVDSDAPLSYQLEFEALGNGAMLVVTGHRQGTGLVPVILTATIVLLAAAILFSLRAARRHMQRRLKAEQALREEYAFRKTMEDSLLTGLRARDLQGRIIYVNPAFCRMVGWSAEELIGRAPPMPYWAPEQADETVATHDRILAGNKPHEAVEMRFRRKNGERFEALIYEAPLIDADGRHTGWMGSVLDITARKRAEELYRQQQEKFQFTARLVTMGEMASMLAHELNQPLSAISSYTTGSLNVLETANPPRSELVETLHKVVAQAHRAGQVIRRVHEFVRRREPRKEACMLNEIVDDAMGLIEPVARQRGVRLQADISPGLPPWLVDRVMIEQLLLNLMRNGMDAMSNVAIERRVLFVSAAWDEKGVRITVSDCGSGISPEVAPHLYEPFFSTKHDGMGMGLNICRSIAEVHHGRLWFEPNPGGGTQFHFWLPEGI